MPEKRIRYFDSTLVVMAGSPRDGRGHGDWKVYFDAREGKDRGYDYCVACGSKCSKALFSKYETAGYVRYKHLYFCEQCNWWRRLDEFCNDDDRTLSMDHTWAILKELPVSSNDVPIELLRKHLAKNFADVREISSQKAEELVAAVFRESFGPCEVNYFRGSTFSQDGGIDLVVVQADRGPSAIQVKRRPSGKTEDVENVRSFVGAVIMNGFRSGVYVSLASRFSSQAMAVSRNPHLRDLGIEIQLLDSTRFYDLLMSLSPHPKKPLWLPASYDVGDDDMVKRFLRCEGAQ
jgi:restriction system protein